MVPTKPFLHSNESRFLQIPHTPPHRALRHLQLPRHSRNCRPAHTLLVGSAPQVQVHCDGTAGQLTLVQLFKVCHLPSPFWCCFSPNRRVGVDFGVRLFGLCCQHFHRDFFHGRLLLLRRRELLSDGFHQGVLSSVCHRPVALVRDSVRLPKGDAPLEKELQLHLHGVSPSFHHDKLALGHGLQLIRGHKGPLHHLQGLGPVVFPLADVTRLYGPAAQGFAHRLGSLAVGANPPKMVSCTLSTMISAPSLP